MILHFCKLEGRGSLTVQRLLCFSPCLLQGRDGPGENPAVHCPDMVSGASMNTTETDCLVLQGRNVLVHISKCMLSLCIFVRTLMKQGPYGGRPVTKKTLIITPGSLVKVI